VVDSPPGGVGLSAALFVTPAQLASLAGV
jgi:hypothetical protein